MATKLARIFRGASLCALATLILADRPTIAHPYPHKLNPPPILTRSLPQSIKVSAVESVGMTVADMDRAVAFYSQVLSFRQISEVEVWGSEYERLQGLFGVRMRVVKMQLGDEIIELIDYLTPGGRPIPVDSRSNDRSFQHLAIVVSDMEQAYQILRQHNVQHVSTAPQRLPEYLKGAYLLLVFSLSQIIEDECSSQRDFLPKSVTPSDLAALALLGMTELINPHFRESC